jgi:hypothetical protein
MSLKLRQIVAEAEVKPKNRKETLALIPEKDYGPGRTKQAFVDQCDINKILKKAQKAGGLAHVQKYPEAVYGEFDGEFDLLTAHGKIARAQEIFDELPAEVRGEFQNNALAFVEFANQPENVGKLAEIIPAIAEPGRYFPNPAERFGQGAGEATAPKDSAPPPATTEVVTEAPVEPDASSST